MYNIQGITLEGMYNYFELIEEPLFKDIHLFEGGTVYNNEWEEGQIIPPINKNIVIDYIMEYNNGLTCYRQIPDRFKQMVNNFFESNYQAFKMIWLAINLDYNPIDNYDRKEYHLNEYDSSTRRTDTTNYKNTDTKEYKGYELDTNTPTGSEQNQTTFSGNEERVNQMSADNNENWSNDTKETITKPTITDTKSFTNSRKTTDKHEFSNDRKDIDTFEHFYVSGNDLNEHLGDDTLKIWSHGNIGVAKTSEIWLDECKARASFNFYELVSKKFAESLLLEIF